MYMTSYFQAFLKGHTLNLTFIIAFLAIYAKESGLLVLYCSIEGIYTL